MTATKITTHEIDGLARLIEQYKDKDNFKALLEPFLSQIQDLENAVYDFFEFLDINTAEGLWLDVIGAIVGVERQGFEDETYRLLIKAQIGINSSEGTPENIIDIFLILSNSTNVTFHELYPATVQIFGDGTPPTGLESLIPALMQQVVLAGVKVEATGEYSDNPFIFASTSMVPSEGGGFSNTSQVEGGELAKIFS